MSKPARNRLLSHYAFTLLNFEDCPKIITEINHLRQQTVDLDSLRNAKGKVIAQIQDEKELEKEIEIDFNVTQGSALPQVKKALLALYKANRVLRENSLDLDVIQAQYNSVKMTSNVCYKMLAPLKDEATDETETEDLLTTLNKIIQSLASVKKDLETRKKNKLAELKTRQQTVRLLENKVSKKALAQEAEMKAAVDNLKAGKELSENEMLLVAIHRWKQLNFRLRESLHTTYLRYVDIFTREKTLEKKVFREMLIAPPSMHEARTHDYEEKLGTSLPATPTDSTYEFVSEDSEFPFLLAHLSFRTVKMIQKWEKIRYLKAAYKNAVEKLREGNLSASSKEYGITPEKVSDSKSPEQMP